MTSIKLAQSYIFRVIKQTEKGYLVSFNDATLELQENHITNPINIGDQIELFLYINQQKNLTVTMKKPLIDSYRAGLVEVVEEKPGLGVFVNIGLDKDMLVSKDDLPHLKKHWPTVGDKLFCQLKGGKNQIIARLVGRYKMMELFSPSDPLNVDEKVSAYVSFIAEEGIVLHTETGQEVFVYFKHIRRDYRLGENTEVMVTLKKDDRHYNGTLIEQKELMLEDDSVRIVKYIEALGGSMPLTDKSNPDAIYAALRMSKAAFKRALGTLYKNELVVLEQDQTILVKKD